MIDACGISTQMRCVIKGLIVVKKTRVGRAPTNRPNVEFFGEPMVPWTESHSNKRELRVLSVCYTYQQLPTKNHSFYVNLPIL